MKKQEGMSSRTSNRSVSVVGTQSPAARRCVQEAFFRILQILLFTFGVSQIQPDLFQRYIDIPLYMAYLDRLTELQIESAYGLDTAKIFAGRTLLPRTAFFGQVNSSFVLVGSDSQDRPHGVSHDSMYPYTYLHYVQGNVGEYGGHPPPTPREVLLKQRRDQFGAVVETLRRRCEGRSPRETHRRWVCMRLGEIHLTEYDEPHQALKYFRIAAEVAGYHQIPEFMFHTALVYERLGNHELAVDTLANVMQQSVPVEGSDDAAEVSDALRGHRYLIRTCYASLHLLHLIDRNLSAIVGYDPTVLYRAFYHLRTYALNTELRRPCAKILMQGAWQLSASIHKQIYYALKDPHDRQWNTLYQQDPDHFVHAVYDHLIRLSRRFQYVEKEQMEALQKTLTNFIDRGVSETDSSEKEYSVVLSRLNLFDLIRYFRRLVCTVSLAESVPSSLCKQRSPVHMSTVQFQRWENAFHCPNLHEALFELHRVMNHAHVLEAFPSLHASGEDQTWLQRTHSLVNMLQAQCVSYYYQLARIYCIPLHSYELHSVTGSMIRVTHHIRNSEMVQKAAIHAQFTLSDECSIADGYSISHAYTHRSSDDTHFSAKNAEPVAMNNRMTTEVSASCASESEGVSSGSEHNDVMNQSTSPKIFRPDPSWLDEIEKRFERCHNKITKIGSLLELCDWAS